MEIVFILCCIRMYVKARAANLNAALWTFYTFISILVAWLAGIVMVAIIFLVRDPNLRSLITKVPADRDAVMKHIMSQNMLIPEIFLMFCGLGGFLFVNYLVSKRTTPPSGDSLT